MDCNRIKCILIGDMMVGKSSFCLKLMGNDFPLLYQSTIGVDFFSKILDLNFQDLKLQIWDTTGQEQFKSITKSFYRNCSFVFLMFDLTDNNTFKNTKKWLNEIYQNCDENITVILIGNKTDLISNVVKEDIDMFCEKYNLKYYKCSVKYDNIENLIKKILLDNLKVNVKSNKIEDDKIIKLDERNKKNCCLII